MPEKRQIHPDRYDEEYLLSENTEGFWEFRNGGISFAKLIQLEKLEICKGIRLLDVGFGRGEFLKQCAQRGAIISGIDYSRSALKIGTETLRDYPDADLHVADCRTLPFAANTFDRVYSGDVIEHQDFEDGILMLKEMYRVLKPGGFLFVHTSPNTIFTRTVLPVIKPILRMIDRESTRILDEHMEVNKTVHIHEYNLFSLRKVARLAGLYDAETWISPDILRSSQHRHTESFSRNRFVRVVARLGRFSLVRFMLGNDLFLKCYKSTTPALQRK